MARKMMFKARLTPQVYTPTTDFPGKPGGNNPVGHLAAPGWPGSFTGGVFGNGSSGRPTEEWAKTFPGQVIPGGTLAAPVTYSFIDFNCGTTGLSFLSAWGNASGPPLNHVKFIGCRFGSSNFKQTTNLDASYVTSDNVTFQYCTFCPSPSIVTAPPLGFGWPSASVGTGEIWDRAVRSTYSILWKQGVFQHLSISAPRGGTGNTVDHCDFWGFGNIAIGLAKVDSAGNIFDGLITITDNWMHDHRHDTAPFWSSSTTYVVDDVATNNSFPELNVYISKQNGNLNHPLPTPSASDSWWEYSNTHDHADGILPGYLVPCRNYAIRHNTIASIGTGQGLAFQSGGPGNSYWLAPVWSNVATYGASGGDRVTSLIDKNMYQSIQAGNTNKEPSANPTWWKNIGPAYYRDISIMSNYCSGYGYHTHLGPNMTYAANIVFRDNIFATDVLFSTGPLYYSDVYASNMVAANGCLWRNNKLVLYPGSGATWASHYAAWDGRYIVPGSTAGGEGSYYQTTDWNN